MKDSTPVTTLASKKTEALVIYLAITGKTHSRDKLADMLWDDRTQERASGNLRVILSSIRKNLGEYFDISRSEVSLKENANICVDAVELENRLYCADISSSEKDNIVQAAQLDQATKLYAGEFMKNYYLRDAVRFEDWLSHERARYHNLVVGAYCDLIQLFSAARNLDAGMEVAGRFLEIDPVNEKAHRCMMRFLAVMDQRAAALRQYEQCREILQSDLGMEPDEKTQSLYRKIVRGEIDKIQSGPIMYPVAGGRLVNNLPRQMTSFVGRTNQIKQIEELLIAEDVRLITLTGPGGVGKTRLAIETAKQMIDSFPDGIVFVNLAPVSDPAMVTGRIARTLNVMESSKQDAVLEMIKTALKDKKALLILDNFEQVIEAATEISEIVSGTDKLKILVTSREFLNIYGEHRFLLSPLETPSKIKDGRTDGVLRYEAVALFVQRAKVANPAFELNQLNAGAIAEICCSLDGIPLAIELAAARSTIYSPDYLAGVMDSALDILDGGPVNHPLRHQKLRAALDWSYRLLSDVEKDLFSGLAVFEGGADLSAISDILPQASGNSQINLLESMANKSLIMYAEGFQGQPRFYMLKTIDQYASEILKASGIEAELRGRHAKYFADMVNEAGKKLLGSDQGIWAARIRQEYDNIIDALRWSFSEGDPTTGMRLFGALWGFWYYDGQATDGLRWLKLLLPWIDKVDRSVLPAVFNTAGMIYYVIGKRIEGAKWNKRALELATRLGDRSNVGWSLFWLSAQGTADPGDYKDAYSHCEKSLVEFEAVGDRGGLAWAYNQLGEINRLLNDYDGALKAYEKSLQISRANKNARREAVALINLSTVAQYQGNSKEAYAFAKDGLAVLNRLGLIYHAAMTLALLAGPLIELGETEKAVRLMGASSSIFASISSDLQPADQQEIDLYAAKAREKVGEARFIQLFDEGRDYSFEQAMRYAMG